MKSSGGNVIRNASSVADSEQESLDPLMAVDWKEEKKQNNQKKDMLLDDFRTFCGSKKGLYESLSFRGKFTEGMSHFCVCARSDVAANREYGHAGLPGGCLQGLEEDNPPR